MAHVRGPRAAASSPPEELADEATEARVDAGTSERSRLTFLVSVLGGPTRPVIVEIGPDAPPVLVGQSPTCELVVTDKRVSRRHLSLEHAGDALRVVDQRSTNGTAVNGVRVEVALARAGDRIQIGETWLGVATRQEGAASPAIASRFGGALGASDAMRRLYPLCARLAASDVPVILEGETGTGKEALAEALHGEGPRAAGPFVVFDCTTVPGSLFESELFGHERGAFTGATTARKGTFELAHGGTLLIDEIGDLDLALQAKLLRAVETSTVRRIGGAAPVRVDVRLLAATRRDLDREVQAGRFRDDLLHRLAVARIELPPLRRRAGDVRLLAEHFWREMKGPPGGPPADLLARWDDAPWPGNVRELRNAVARAIALGDLADATPGEGRAAAPSEVGGESLDAAVERALAAGQPLPEAREAFTRAFERRFLDAVIGRHGGDLDAAAARAGIGRRYLNMLRARTRG